MATYWKNSCSFGLLYVFILYKCLFFNLVVFFFHIGFWRGILILIAPSPGRCLLVPFLSLLICDLCLNLMLIYDLMFFVVFFNYELHL